MDKKIGHKKNIKEPCAYCGTVTIKRTFGHVFSENLYSDNLTEAKRIIVPECLDCKARWENADPHFRNVVTVTWHPEKLQMDSRAEKMFRSFQKCDGLKRWRDLAIQMNEVIHEDIVRHKIFPMKDVMFVLVLKRIIRGLCHHHRIGTSISEEDVVCNEFKFIIPPEIEEKLTWNIIADSFIKYSYLVWPNDEISSSWLLDIGTQMRFIAWIKKR